MSELRFFLPTTIELFTNWLKFKNRNGVLEKLKLGKNSAPVFHELVVRESGDGISSHIADFSVVSPLDDGDWIEKASCQEPIKDISFEMLTIESERIEVIGRFSQRPCSLYFLELLFEIADTWNQQNLKKILWQKWPDELKRSGFNAPLIGSETKLAARTDDANYEFPSMESYTPGPVFQKLPVQFDVLDGVTSRRVCGYAAKLGEAKREVIIPNSRVVYHLENDQLGSVGAVELLKTCTNECQIHFCRPMRPKGRRPSKDEKAPLKGLEGDEYIAAYVRVLKQIDQEVKELLEKRNDHQTVMREAYFAGLIEDVPSLSCLAQENEEYDEPDALELNRAGNASTELVSEGESTGRRVDKRVKRGPHKYSTKEKLAALDAWENLDKYIYPIKLEDWLEERFGSEGGVLHVAPSTFYGWKRYREKSS